MTDDILPGYIRVTNISSAFSSYGSIPKTILENAKDRGTQIHDLIRDTILDIPVDNERFSYMDRKPNGEFKKASLLPYLDSFWKFWKEHEATPAIFPDRLYDNQMMLTGEFDLITMIDGERTLIDWKCTAASSPAWDIQANGYAMLYENNHLQVIDRMLFVRLDKEGKDPEVLEIKHDPELFITAYVFYKRFFKDIKCNLERE